jgi:hypothetical protein
MKPNQFKPGLSRPLWQISCHGWFDGRPCKNSGTYFIDGVGFCKSCAFQILDVRRENADIAKAKGCEVAKYSGPAGNAYKFNADGVGR